MIRAILALGLTFFAIACDRRQSPEPASVPAEQVDAQPAGSETELVWMKPEMAERFTQIENQFGGFSQTMMEVDYRYQALYWAGQDENWPYVRYQVEHIEEAIEKGMTRRPARAESATAIFPVLKAVNEAAEAKDAERFQATFAALTNTCNSCHVAEDVGFMQVRPPEVRAHAIYGE